MTHEHCESDVTRRRLLALSGVGTLASLAGCSGLLPGEGERTVAADALADAVADDPPTVPETLPVEIEASFVDEQRSTAESDLAAVPAPFDREEIPNGVIRARLNDTHESATDSIGRIDEAETPYDRRGRANSARVDAHQVRAAWRAIAADLTLSSLAAEASAIEDAIDEVVGRWSYIGDDPVRAVVVHEEIETEIKAARNWVSAEHRQAPRDGGTALDVADLAEDHERARTSVAVASYVFDRFRTSLDATAEQRSRFGAARAELRERIRGRMGSLPAEDVDNPTALVDRDVDETTGVRALASLGSEARYRADDALEADDGPTLASNIIGAADALVYTRAFNTLRERIDGGDDVAVESVADVAQLRADATDAVEQARTADRGELLVRAMLPWYANEIRWTDDQFERESGSVSLDSVSFDAIDYVVAAATCRAIAPVSADVATTLRDP